MPGRKPKPLAQKMLHGNPGKRALNHNEPAYGGSPECPLWLAPDAQTEWQRILKELDGIGLLRSTDQSALAAYCQAFARWKTAEAIIDREGQTIQEPIVNKQGEICGHKTKRHPATIIAKDERTSMQKAASTFGFDPSARSKISIPEVKDKPVAKDFEDDLYATPAPSNSRRSIH